MKPVKLGVFAIDQRHVRFFMIDRNNKLHNSNNIHMTGCHPLFLGTDILHGTSEWGKNMSRIHARLAKQGLATKLVFTDCRIDGLRKGDEAYFYSVFGLFRVVFEYHPFSVQQQCLQLLTDVWMKTSAESLPQLKAKYEVSLQTLLLVQVLPPAAADREDGGQTEDKAPAPSRQAGRSKTPHAPKLPMLHIPGQQISSNSASARLGNSVHSLQETSSRAAAQDSGTQTDLSFFTAGTPPGIVVLLETVCKMCGFRQKRTEREQAEVDPFIGLSKKPRRQLVETGESIRQVGMFMECPEEDPAAVTGMKSDSDLQVKAVGVRSTDGCFSRRRPSPSSATSFSSGSPMCLAGESDSKIRTGFSSSSSQPETQEPHVHTKVKSGTDDSVSALNQSSDSHKTHTLPQQMFQETAQHSNISEREEVSMDGAEHDLGSAQAQKVSCHVQTQTYQTVFNPVTHSFSEVDSLSVLDGVKTSIADRVFCLEPSIGLKNNVQGLTDAAENNVQMLTDAAENNVQMLTDAAENNVQILTDTAENNVQVLTDAAENNVQGLTDAAENNVQVLTDAAENNVQMLTDAAENNVQMLTDAAENNVQILTDAAKNNAQVLTDAVPYRYNEFSVEKIEDHVFQTGIADVAECVQNWIKQVQELKLLLETEDTTFGARDSCEDAVPDSARRAPLLGAPVPDSARRAPHEGGVLDSAKSAPHLEGAMPDSAKRAPHLEGAMPDSAKRAPHLDVPDSAKRAPHLDPVPDSAKGAPHLGAPVPDSAKKAPHLGAPVPYSAKRAPHLHLSQLEILQLILEFFLPIMDAVGVTTPSDVSTVSEILTQILNAAENSAELASASPEWPVMSPLKLSVLTTVGTWLGEEFRRLKPAIFQKVTAFKQKHINNIGGLPSAVEIIAELFPSCMAQFVGAWIGLADSQNAEAMEKDHCYQHQSGSGTVSAQQQNRSQFPLIQLVLELLNNSLVSGIAHVVFCKL